LRRSRCSQHPDEQLNSLSGFRSGAISVCDKIHQTEDFRQLTQRLPSVKFIVATKLFYGETTMSMKILEECIACGACVPECPTESISEGDGITYVIDQATCVECVGHHDSPKCASVCPVECIVKA